MGQKVSQGIPLSPNNAENGAQGRPGTGQGKDTNAYALYSALRAINLAEVVMPDGYHWRPTIVRGYPSFDKLDSIVIVQIELLSGSDHGPAVDKPNLINVGAISDPAFDLELGLTYLRDEALCRLALSC